MVSSSESFRVHSMSNATRETLETTCWIQSSSAITNAHGDSDYLWNTSSIVKWVLEPGDLLQQIWSLQERLSEAADGAAHLNSSHVTKRMWEVICTFRSTLNTLFTSMSAEVLNTCNTWLVWRQALHELCCVARHFAYAWHIFESLSWQPPKNLPSNFLDICLDVLWISSDWQTPPWGLDSGIKGQQFETRT